MLGWCAIAPWWRNIRPPSSHANNRHPESELADRGGPFTVDAPCHPAALFEGLVASTGSMRIPPGDLAFPSQDANVAAGSILLVRIPFPPPPLSY